MTDPHIDMPVDMTDEVAADIATFSAALASYADGGDLSDRSELASAAKQLARHLPGFDASTGLMPWERDDDFYYEDLELPGWFGAGVDVVYETHSLVSSPATIARIASKYVELANSVSELITFHPAYDVDTGDISHAAAS